MNRIPRNPEHHGAERSPGSLRPARPMFAITDAVVTQSEHWLRSPRWNGRESIVYWAGLKREDVWLVTTVIKPKAVTRRGSFTTSSRHNARVIEFLSDAGLALLGQVHTHEASFVNHSQGDDEDAFMPRENSMSLVVPHFGREGMRPLDRCGVHRYEAGRFRRLDAEEIESDLCIVPMSRNLAR